MKTCSVLLLVLLMTSCDRFTTIKGEIYNKSRDTVTVRLNLDDSISTWNIAPQGTFKEFSTISGEKLPRKNFKCCPCAFKSLLDIVPKDPGKTLKKDFKSSDNWHMDKSLLKSEQEITCSFEINPGDIN